MIEPIASPRPPSTVADMATNQRTGTADVQLSTEGWTLDSRRQRGAFFTPYSIAQYLAQWAVGDDPNASVLDPTCGEAAFLLAAAERLRTLGTNRSSMSAQIFGVDLHEASVQNAKQLLNAEDADATLLPGDFFEQPPPGAPGSRVPQVDAVLGNPPYVRFQAHSGDSRRRSAAAALAQGVRLPGTASSWAATLVHAAAFLKPTGRLAMVVPAELLTVGYAEPIRQWLKSRFANVRLIFFERLQFEDAIEKVILLIASGTGGCDSFSLGYVEDAEDLLGLHPLDLTARAPAGNGKWTDLLLTVGEMSAFRRATASGAQALSEYGTIELGTVTGANGFFCLTEETRQRYGLQPDRHVIKALPPGSRHLTAPSFTRVSWNALRDAGERVWMLRPQEGVTEDEIAEYLEVGIAEGVNFNYKCRVRATWWRPPAVRIPDLYFTYMSHRYPRLVENQAKVAYVNSLHGLRLQEGTAPVVARFLPLLCLNSMTMVGAELQGRSYGGGILKMEPREAATLPVPKPAVLQAAAEILHDKKSRLDRQLKAGEWLAVTKTVDKVILGDVLNLPESTRADLWQASRKLRSSRLGAADDDSTVRS